MVSKKKTKVCIVGAGPAGLGAALAFHNNGYDNVCVYEKRSDVSSHAVEESYLVGVNTRGKRALKFVLGVDEYLGNTVSSWDVFVSPYEIQVASFKSGTVASTTRSTVVSILLKHVQAKGIPIYCNHSVTSADSSKHTITFDTKGGTKTSECDCLIVADGYRSCVRQALEGQSASLRVRQWPWPVTFRVLLSTENDGKDDKLSPSVHYIFNGIYVAQLDDGRWAAVTSCKDLSEKEAFLLSDQPTTDNVEKLKAHLKSKAPMISNMFSDEELRSYFGRPSFAGAATWVSQLLVDNWALLVGDAAHSTFPATGEGVNASLEDAYVLQQVLAEDHCDAEGTASMQDILSTYQDRRLADTHALSDIAYSVLRPSGKQVIQKVALTLSCGCLSGSKVLGKKPIQELLFGPSTATSITPYSEIVDEWQKQLQWIGGRPHIPPESC